MNVGNRKPIDKNVSKTDYASDIKYAVYYIRLFLTILGTWPYITSNPTTVERYLSKIVIPVCSITMMMLISTSVSYIVVRDLDQLTLIMVLGPISFTFSTLFKYVVLILRCKSIRLCIEHMKIDWLRIDRQSDRDIMMKNLKVGHDLTVIVMICMYSNGMFYHLIKPLCSGNVINEFNETIRPLSLPGIDIFVDLEAGFNYEIVFCVINISIFLHFTVPTALCNLGAIFVTHACGQIEIIMSRLESLVDFDKEYTDIHTIEDRLAFIVPFHVRVLRFSSKIDEILREMCLMEVVSTTLNMCFVEYYCIMEWSNSDAVGILTYAVALFALCFNIFIFCHIGELLKEQCCQVGKTASMIEWYKLPGKSGLALIMIIAMSNYPRKLTAGRMMELSIVTFGSIMKTTFAYLNMLRTVVE